MNQAKESELRGTAEFYSINRATYASQTAVSAYKQMLKPRRRAAVRRLMTRFLREIPSGGRILDVGCGTGKDVNSMRRFGFAAQGMDLSPAMVAIATEAYGPHFHCGDLLNPAGSGLGVYDGIVLLAVLQHILPDDAAHAFASLTDMLSPSGTLLVIAKEGQGLTEDFRLGREFPRRVVLYREQEIATLITQAGLVCSHIEVFSTTRAGKTDPWVGALAKKSGSAAPRNQ